MPDKERGKKLERLFNLFVGFAVILGLVFTQIPSPMNNLVAEIISTCFVLLLVWIFVLPRISKKLKIPLPKKITFERISLFYYCFVEGASMYMLYRTSYLWGAYSILVPLGVILQSPMPNEVSTLYEGLAVSSVGIVSATIAIATTFYFLGLLRGEKLMKVRLRRRPLRSHVSSRSG